MISLFHGTSNSHYDAIMSEGLVPGRKSNWTSPGKVPPPPDLVYLTSCPFKAQFYGLRSAVANGSPQYTIFDCEVDEDKLYPDENYILGVGRFITTEEMKEVHPKIKEHKASWKRALETISAVCHEGPINPVIHHKTAPLEDNIYYFLANQSLTIQEMDNKMYCLLKAQFEGVLPYFMTPEQFTQIKMSDFSGQCVIWYKGELKVVYTYSNG